MLSRRKYLRLLSCHLINKRIKLHSKKRLDGDILFRFEYEGSYLKEYYMSFEDAKLAIRVNGGNMVAKREAEFLVFSLPKNITCIVSL